MIVLSPLAHVISSSINPTQSSQIRINEAYPQGYINELTIWIFRNRLVVSRMEKWLYYWKIEPTSSSKTTANGFNVPKNQFLLILSFEMTKEFNIQICMGTISGSNDQFINVLLRGALYLVWL